MSGRFTEVVLFLEDIEQIVATLQSIAPVRIRTGSYALDSFAELKELNEDCVNSLYLHCVEPFAYIDIDEKSVRVFLGSDVPEHRRVFEQVAAILEKRQLVRDQLFESPTIIGALCGAALSILFGVYFIAEIPWQQKHLAGGSSVLMIVLLILWDRFTLRQKRTRTSRIWLRHLTRSEALRQQYWDRILLVILVMIVTALFALLLQSVG
ncbi:MAG: hypothetical protein AAB229_07070 [Candidatus Hydrogenedentota bacterium]